MIWIIPFDVMRYPNYHIHLLPLHKYFHNLHNTCAILAEIIKHQLWNTTEQVKLYTGTLVLELIELLATSFVGLSSSLSLSFTFFAICRILLDFSCSCDISLCTAFVVRWPVTFMICCSPAWNSRVAHVLRREWFVNTPIEHIAAQYYNCSVRSVHQDWK